jgi:diaminopimelate decarboxylase
MTCDGIDVITQNISVPVDLNISDWLCISGMGAYSYGSKSSFNGMQATSTILKWNSNLDHNKKL